MKIRNTSHIAIGVSNMEQSLKFYRDLLGLKVTLDDPTENPGGALPKPRHGPIAFATSFAPMPKAMNRQSPIARPITICSTPATDVSLQSDAAQAHCSSSRRALRIANLAPTAPAAGPPGPLITQSSPSWNAWRACQIRSAARASSMPTQTAPKPRIVVATT